MRETAQSQAAVKRCSIAERWKDLHQSAEHLARLAALSPEPFRGEIAAFPGMIGEAHEWQRELAWQGLEDIDAMMRPGLAALHTITARGASPTAPALSLWREFHAARSALMALAPVEEANVGARTLAENADLAGSQDAAQ